MASITGKKNLFFVTSPRTPDKMKAEIDLLVNNFSGQKWNKSSQKSFANLLRETDFFEGSLAINSDFGARDRINRSPKALGMVDLKPITLTDAGEKYIYGSRPNEIFTRQLLKFQLPSPFHIDKKGTFNVKPYLELMRMVYELDGISKDEVQAFFMEMISYDKFDEIKNRILEFRKQVRTKKTNYKKLLDDAMSERLLEVYAEEIRDNAIKTRESKEVSIKKFLRTKKSNQRDYADASVRYLRETELFEFEPRTYRLLIATGKEDDVKYILDNVEREPYNYSDENDYKQYLYNANYPLLLTDNKDGLIASIISVGKGIEDFDEQSLALKDIEELKDIQTDVIETVKTKNIESTKNKLASYDVYEDIQNVYKDIRSKTVIDAPLHFEWNTWRAMTMITEGNIQGNFRVDTEANPLHTAPGNQSDIYCDYDSYDVIVEVTLSRGHKQYEMEGEPISRHLARQKDINKEKGLDKESYCLFIAQKVSDATLAYIYSMHRIDIAFYGGKSKIIPLNLDDFQLLLEKFNQKDRKKNTKKFKEFLELSCEKALETSNEKQWKIEIEKIINNF